MVDGKSLVPGIVSYCQEMAARDEAAWMFVRIVLHLVIETRSLPLYYYASDGNGAWLRLSWRVMCRFLRAL
jgi:hypothetical protein